MALPPGFLEELRARIRLSDVVGRRVRLVRRGREHTGLCPFHNEKTPSFTVSDDKGFYYCFGCGAKGDAIDFEMKLGGFDFRETVERLAGEAGLAVPAEDPDARRKAERREGLVDVIEEACRWFESRLGTDEAAPARDYLRRRGFGPESWQRFRFGYAPDRRDMLIRTFEQRGVKLPQLLEVGLARQREDRSAFDYFRGRLIIPIADRRGRIIAFGGRVLGDGEPKYLNSPDTPLFEKGRVLYGWPVAREAARRAGTVLVAEGYLDVAALVMAGRPHAVAPLGTALTEMQIEELWRMAPEPILCLDGDSAGIRAARRAAERALPLLRPGLSLRFARLPGGHDPDSLIRTEGVAAFDRAIAQPQPMVDLLWQSMLESHTTDTPERMAALEADLMTLADTIREPLVRDLYRRDFRDRVWQLRRNRRSPSGGPQQSGQSGYGQGAGFGKGGGYAKGRGGKPPRPGDLTDDPSPIAAPALGTGRDGQATRREAALLAGVLLHPQLLDVVENEVANLPIATPSLDMLRAAIVDTHASESGLDSDRLRDHLRLRGFADLVERLMAPAHTGRVPFFTPGAAFDRVLAGWRNVLAVHRHAQLVDELKAAERELVESMTEEALQRFVALKRLVDENERALAAFDQSDGFDL
ncbi:DNA primase [Tistrella bauzanensis]|uniref:DNA primase n=1 Tax=Tistrella TaxID=171436 RepID=UPI0031F6A620